MNPAPIASSRALLTAPLPVRARMNRRGRGPRSTAFGCWCSDPRLAARADRVIALRQGRVVEERPGREVAA